MIYSRRPSAIVWEKIIEISDSKQDDDNGKINPKETEYIPLFRTKNNPPCR